MTEGPFQLPKTDAADSDILLRITALEFQVAAFKAQTQSRPDDSPRDRGLDQIITLLETMTQRLISIEQNVVNILAAESLR